MSRAPVLVVGAGPVGLVLACELARRGVDVRVVDKLPEPSPLSKAIAVHARTLEHLDRLGVAEALVPLGVKTTGMTLVEAGKELASIDFTGVESRFPYALCVPQTDTEAALTDRLRALGVDVDRGVELVGAEQSEDGVTATLRRDDGDEQLACSFVAGCDGGHSAVRKLAGQELDGSFHGLWFLLADCDARTDLDHDRMLTVLHHEGVLAYFPLAGERCRLIIQLGETRPDAAEPTLAETADLVEARTDGRVRIDNARWLAYFEIHHGQVAAYRANCLFLAGDAAHVHSPAGGQGMNTGIQDAVNLAWKLQLAWNGAAGPALLDSYHDERRPVGAHVIRMSQALIQAGTVTNPAVRALRHGLAWTLVGHSPVAGRLADDVTEVDVAYRRSPLVGGVPHRPRGALRPLHPGDFAPDVDGIQSAGGCVRLAELFAADAHTALFVANDDGERCAAAATALGQNFGGLVRRVLVTRDVVADDRFDVLGRDPAQAVSARYGAADALLALVRPDGYLAYLGEPADLATAEALLARAIG